MKPTEQDSELDLFSEDALKIAEALRSKYPNIWRLLYYNHAMPEVIEFITADRKRVALEARLNEVQNAYECWINGRNFISSYFRDRIALLSNTKESK